MDVLLEVVGWGGTAAFVAAYIFVSNGKIKADGLLYQWLNLGGAIAVGFSVFPKKAWPAFGLEIIWGTIALTALIGIYRAHARSGQKTGQGITMPAGSKNAV